VSRDREKLRVLEEFTRERQLAELAAKAEEAEREMARAESSREAAISKASSDFEATQVTAGLEKSVLEKLQKQLDHCIVRAPQDGVVVYHKEKRGPSIELGAMAHFKQKLFTLPDLTQMQVKAYVHESVIKKVKGGLKAEIRIDAIPNVVLEGEVDDVATFYDSSRQYSSGGVKEYATKVRITGAVDVGLKPGMTAEVKILAGELTDALLVPLQAVAEQSGQYVCFVIGAAGVERREVSIGDNTDSFIEIKTGVSVGEQVALNARARAASDANSNHKKENGNGTPDRKPTTPADSVAVSQAGL
jgi:RND family efflux transporter MFP subunit